MRMDIADRADGEVEGQLAEALWKAKHQPKVPESFDGECYCGEVHGKRFCGADCRDLYDLHERAKARAGR